MTATIIDITNFHTKNLIRDVDFKVWMEELHGIMKANYGFSETTIARYGDPENWEDYYNDEYSALEAIQEDEELYWEIA